MVSSNSVLLLVGNSVFSIRVFYSGVLFMLGLRMVCLLLVLVLVLSRVMVSVLMFFSVFL